MASLEILTVVMTVRPRLLGRLAKSFGIFWLDALIGVPGAGLASCTHYGNRNVDR